MSTTQLVGRPSPGALRLWPGIAAAVILLIVRYLAPVLIPGSFGGAILGGVVLVLAILIWWLAFSRAPWAERIGAVLLMIAAVAATSRFVHKSIAGGMMGMMLPVYAMPVLSVALVGWAMAAQRWSVMLRRVSLIGVITLASAAFTLIRTDGITADSGSQLAWRWTPTAEELLIARGVDETQTPAAAPASTGQQGPAAPPAPAPLVAAPAATAGTTAPVKSVAAPPIIAAATSEAAADWPGFRGPRRDGTVRGVRIGTDWATTPPVRIWQRPIGPGWSSFAVHGDVLYTQEQRGDDEIVASYRVSTGEPVWRHRDPVRFWESNGGAGPRGTPAVAAGRVYAFGATGILNALDAATGRLLWSHNVASDTGRQVPDWGFASSPLVLDDLVVVAASGTLAGYDAASGKLRWVGPSHGGSYSSPQRATIDGVPQVLLLSEYGTTSVAPAEGTLLWEHPWEGSAIVQPALTTSGDVVVNTIASTGGVGTRRLAVAHSPDGWRVEEKWTSTGLKPYFNDFVLHNGHAYGFDGSILACIDLEDGKRKWKGGRYGSGQLLLLGDEDLLLVLSEDGELALVKATPDQFTELARVPGIEGKTWNHPVLIGGTLLVRNGQQMAAFRLPMAKQ